MNKTKVDLQHHNMIADRKSISDAVEYNKKIWRTLSDEERIYVEVGFYVFWNTLAKHYELYKKGEDNVLLEQKHRKDVRYSLFKYRYYY